MNLRTTVRWRRAGIAGLALIGLAAAALPGSAALKQDRAAHGGAAQLAGDNTANLRAQVKGGHAKNVILLIGDGMGASEITAARNYSYGAGGRLPGIDALPLTGQYTTYSLSKDGKPDYDPDSASTGSAWSTGTKTYDGAISVDIAGAPQKTLLEYAKANGLKTGNVSTAELQDATPAVQIAHISARGCYGPVKTSASCPEAALENGGPGSITEQLINTRPDVTLGGGAATFAETATAGHYAGRTLLDQAKDRGYQVVTDKAGLDKLGKADQNKPVLGLFAPGNMPVRWIGPQATADGGSLPATRCQLNPAREASQPSLADLTNKAIKLLKNGDKGFFLQVEGASIDKQDHAADACGQIGETIDLDEAVQAAMTFAKKDGNTSVFVTADHSHTSQIVEAGSVTPGITTNLLTNEGSPMTISYATAAKGGSQQHTGAELPVAGYGPQAANIVGLIDQTDLFFIMSRALNLKMTPAQLSKNAKVTVAPKNVKAGKGLVVEASRYLGDSAATVTITKGASTVELGSRNLNAGAATVLTTAPGKAGNYRVVLVGKESGEKVTAGFTVKK
ncbi:alkaline phosphatase [Nakamurella lactea]|uniref:alkaline phosphatase n=1 Tax=Nakamurella lactea TaxID=459515 RepID=UPI0004042DAB|nr:alkaline phosphatase [Nakamurella lactea]